MESTRRRVHRTGSFRDRSAASDRLSVISKKNSALLQQRAANQRQIPEKKLPLTSLYSDLPFERLPFHLGPNQDALVILLGEIKRIRPDRPIHTAFTRAFDISEAVRLIKERDRQQAYTWVIETGEDAILNRYRFSHDLLWAFWDAVHATVIREYLPLDRYNRLMTPWRTLVAVRPG